MRTRLFWICLLTGVLGTAPPVFAHKLLVDCRIKDNRVRVEAFYDDDTPAQQAKIFIENTEKKIIAEGRTDDRGVWTHRALPAGTYLVRAESVGHSAKETLVVRAVKPAPTPVEPNPKESVDPEPKTATTTKSASSAADETLIEEPPQRQRPTREEKTETPWLRFIIGFAIIGFLCAAFVVVRQRTARE